MIFCLPLYLKNKKLNLIINETADYQMILIDKRLNNYKVLEDAFNYIDEVIRPNMIVFNKMKYSDSLINLYNLMSEKDFKLQKRAYKAYLMICDVAPYCFLNEEYKFKRKQINDIKRCEKKLCENHKLVYEDTNVISTEDLAFITQIKDKNFGDTIFHNKKYWEFFLQLSKDIPDKILVNKLFIDEELVAMHFGFQDESKVYYYTPVYNDKYKNYGVGMILLYHILEKAKKDGKKVFDSCAGQETYKFNFCDRESTCFKFVAIRYNGLFNKIRIFFCKVLNYFWSCYLYK